MIFVMMSLAAVTTVIWKQLSRPHGPILCGQVLDENKQPIAGAKVVVWTGLVSWFKAHETTTNARGQYFIAPVRGARIVHEGDGIDYLQFRLSVSKVGYHPLDIDSCKVKVPDIDRYRHVQSFGLTDDVRGP